MSELVYDIEATGFLDDSNVDYTASPWKLKDHFKIHCIALEDVNTGEEFEFVQDEVYTGFKQFLMKVKPKKLIAHNQVGYDLVVIKAALGIDYDIYNKTLMGEPCEFIDTLVMSKTLNPDRAAHSIDYFGQLLGLEKIDWRAKAIELGLIAHNAPAGEEFKVYHPEMLVYNKRDVKVNIKVLNYLLKEWGNWNWDDSFNLELNVRDIITRQEQRGFYFNTKLAEDNLKFLDAKMEETRLIVEPMLPPKPMGKTKLKDYTPPKTQFLKSGKPNHHITNFATKHSGVIEEREDGFYTNLYGKEYKLPLAQEPILTTELATVKDTTHIKGWLVQMGWKPTAYKERDLTCDAKKKKLSQEKFEEAVHRYVEQTLNSSFCKDRCDELGVSKSRLEAHLLKHDIKRPLKVYTNPTLTVGMEKEIDPALLELSEKFPHAKLVSEYLTYSHRRNSILGGGMDFDEYDEDEEPSKGFLAYVRNDNRIPTPADTCGAGTSRFKHRITANIPRVTSLFGKNMRGMFGVDTATHYQLGYDFDSLEAKIESHYVYKYEGGPEYGVSLTAEKPNDCHSVLARKITGILSKDFPRSTAKNVKYGCLPTDNTEVLTPYGWKTYAEISVGDVVFGHKDGELIPTIVNNLWFYRDAKVVNFGHSHWKVECTEDHKWLMYKNVRSKLPEMLETIEARKDSKLIISYPYIGGTSGVKPHEAALVAWLLSDGYYKWSEKADVTSSSKGRRKGIVASIAQASHKYQDELRQTLIANSMQWVEDDIGSVNENSNISFRLVPEEVRKFLDRVVGDRKQKHCADWCKWIISLDLESIKAFLQAFWLADGYTTAKGKAIRQNKGNIADAVMLAGFLTGKKVTQGTDYCSRITISDRNETTLQTAKSKYVRTADVFCLTTGTGSFVIRQGNLITLTGNCSYNAQPARVAKTVGCDLATGQIIFDAFWEQAYPLKQLKDKMQLYWETIGQKKFLLGIDGRKLPIRSKGNVINTAFQSAGVICAKRAMVIHEQKLKAAGMLIDFWKDDWKNKDFVQQLIAYHKQNCGFIP